MLFRSHPHADGRLHVVFGCGGDRDIGKRAEMGAIAKAAADVVIVTDDNPRTEAAADIRGEILAAVPSATEIAERADAIGITSALYAQGRTFQERFEDLKVSDMMAPSVMCCATRKRWEPKPAVRAFIRAMKDPEAAVAETASIPARRATQRITLPPPPPRRTPTSSVLRSSILAPPKAKLPTAPKPKSAIQMHPRTIRPT